MLSLIFHFYAKNLISRLYANRLAHNTIIELGLGDSYKKLKLKQLNKCKRVYLHQFKAIKDILNSVHYFNATAQSGI